MTNLEIIVDHYKTGVEPRIYDDDFFKLVAIVESAKLAEETLWKVYSGYPNKMEWPEIHYLRQALEALG